MSYHALDIRHQLCQTGFCYNTEHSSCLLYTSIIKFLLFTVKPAPFSILTYLQTPIPCNHLKNAFPIFSHAKALTGTANLGKGQVDVYKRQVSHHLRPLRNRGLIVSRRVGKEVYYKAADTQQSQLLHHMIDVYKRQIVTSQSVLGSFSSKISASSAVSRICNSFSPNC